MFLMVGLLGMALSGALMLVPDGEVEGSGDPTSTDGPDSTRPGAPAVGHAEPADILDFADPPGSEVADASAPTPDHGADDAAPADMVSSDRADATPKPADAVPTPPLFAADAEPVVRDLLPGTHLTDAAAGSSGTPIAHRADAILGGSGADALSGSDSGDLILGNDGDDMLEGAGGRDELIGGEGDDAIYGGGGGDIAWGDAGDDVLRGGDGDDFLAGGDGHDRLEGGAGDDRLFGQGGSDTLDGGAGDDMLDGSEFEPGRGDHGDHLRGGDGDDTLAGGAGDTLAGGAGADLHILGMPTTSAWTDDLPGTDDAVPVIEDFDPAQDTVEVIHDGDGDVAPAVELLRTQGGTSILVDEVPVAHVAGPAVVTLDHLTLIRSAA